MKSEKKYPPFVREFPLLLLVSSTLAVFLTFINFGCQQFPIKQTTFHPPSGSELFKSKCSTCHKPELALQKHRSAKTWLETITRMKEEHNGTISKDEITLLVQYHVERQKQEAALFEEKCQKCHPGKVFLEKNLGPDQARAIIKRMQQKAGNNIEDKDIDIIVRYHVQAQQAAMEKSLTAISSLVQKNQPERKRDLSLFLEKCSTCHEPSRALSVIQDQEAWNQTIKRMQSYSKGKITDKNVRSLVDFHITQQQEEINAIQETCTKCHDDERINNRSMSEEQWLATIKRMQQKDPELITDEKIALLSAYFHRRELSLARVFYGQCRFCHIEVSQENPSQKSDVQMNGLIILASEKLGRRLEAPELNNFLTLHVQRQKRSMQLYEKGCITCHQKGVPEPKGSSQEKSSDRSERSRAEWISFIAALQGTELSKKSQSTIDCQIDFHIARQ
jgi:mono/diheme cytochrome c family protein